MENGQGGKKGGKEGGKAPQPSGAAVCSLSGHVHTQVNTRHQAQCLADRRLPDSGENPLLGPDTARPHPGPALEATLGMRGDREGREGGREGGKQGRGWQEISTPILKPHSCGFFFFYSGDAFI